MKYGFQIDINKCTGCQACKFACIVDNNLPANSAWRNITTYNDRKFESNEVYHLSMACNHCDEPVCLVNCPSNAYSKNEENGIVIHHEEKCIGCKYCTFVCPFDAPKFNSSKKIVGKCDFCFDRIENGLQPACVAVCPTGAIKKVELNDFDSVVAPEIFPNIGNKPVVDFINLKAERIKPQILNQASAADEKKFFGKLTDNYISKISLSKEWTLLLFSFIAAVLFAEFFAFAIEKININKPIYFIIGVFSFLFASVHIGRKTKFSRALLNFKSSWLSREMLFYALFFGSSVIHIFIYPSIFIAIFSILTGLAALYSVDKIYISSAVKNTMPVHSAQTVFTGLFLFAILADFTNLVIILGVFKLVSYVYRKISFIKAGKSFYPFMSIFRVSSLCFVLFPIVFSEFYLWSSLIFIPVLSSEFADRLEFYTELDIITPQGKAQDLLEEKIHSAH